MRAGHDRPMGIRIGYKASAEQFAPRELLDFAVRAEDLGLDLVAISDHFQPWRHHGGHAPSALTWLGAAGQATHRVALGTSVLTPTLRWHPSMIAQAFATLATLNPGRVFLGVGSGEAMNETPATGAPFPGPKERRMRLAESITLMRQLWTQERVDFEGEFYRTDKATIYDRPETPVPIFVAASGPLAARLAGRVGDGFICTSGKDPALYATLLDNVVAGATAAGRDPAAIRRMIEVKVSYDHSGDFASEFMTGHMRQVHIGIMTHPAVPVAATQSAGFNCDHSGIRFRIRSRDFSYCERLLKLFENGRFHNAVPVTPRLDALFLTCLVS